MPGLLNLNRRRFRIQWASSEDKSKRQLKQGPRKYSTIIKIIKLASAILVPLMIGVFTVVTTLQESRHTRMQRDADLEKLERQAQLQQEAEQRQRERDDTIAKEVQSQSIYDTFMRDMSSIVLKDNNNLTIPEILFARAKTFLTLEQIDLKRKWYLIKFLYDSQLLYTRDFGMKYVDLVGVDLSNVEFGGNKFNRRTDLRGIRLRQVQLRNASFESVGLNLATFEFSDLNHSNFMDVSITGASFKNTIMENSNFTLINLINTSFENSKLKSSLWTTGSIPGLVFLQNIDYFNSDLSYSIFKGIKIANTVKFDGANFQQIQFIDIKFSVGTIFKNLNMGMSKFVDIRLEAGKFIQCNMTGAIFEKTQFENVVFENVDLQHSQFNNIPEFGSTRFNKVNLIGSNLNVSRKQVFRITDSLLPNGTFETSYKEFGINMIKNGNAEQGLCSHSFNQSSTAAKPQGWSNESNVIQVFYNNSDWRRNHSNYTSDLYSCFFFGGNQGLNQSNSNGNKIRQEINVERLSILINSRQAKYHASAYLGGFEDEQSSTSMKIGFKNMKNQFEYVVLGPVTNTEREDKTAMVYKVHQAIIPSNTILITIELIFHRQKSQRGSRFGMADNLEFIIQRR